MTATTLQRGARRLWAKGASKHFDVSRHDGDPDRNRHIVSGLAIRETSPVPPLERAR
jgi:hypothetical protein